MSDTVRFGGVHLTKAPNRGSKVGTAVLVVLVVGGGLGGSWFWSNEAAQVEQLSKRGPLALPAAYVLTWKGASEKTEEPLRDALEHGEPRLRAQSAKALATLRRRENVAFLGDSAVNDPEESVRLAAVVALGQNGETNAQPFLQQALEDSSIPVQSAACRAAGKLRLTALIPHLIERLKHHDGDLLRAAREGLEEFTPEGISFEFDPGRWQKWYEEGR